LTRFLSRTRRIVHAAIERNTVSTSGNENVPGSTGIGYASLLVPSAAVKRVPKKAGQHARGVEERHRLEQERAARDGGGREDCAGEQLGGFEKKANVGAARNNQMTR
jgi:hypothetical protein